ncbi:MAG: hypothetical protein HKM04_00785 [Legionellales bacterium]|nr:hypothetical protein [Legionellales bacterium]
MRNLIHALRLHLLFIVLINIMYVLVYLFRPQQLDSYWFYLYMAVCIFIYLATGWVVMHEFNKRRLALLGGLLVFLVGYLIQLIGIFASLVLLTSIKLNTAVSILLKLLTYGVYYALIAIALAFIGAHICNQYRRHTH